MITWLDFKTANGSKHPEAEDLKTSPLAQLILENLQKHQDVFGDINAPTVYLSDDGSLGEMLLAPDSRGRWVPITCVPVNQVMFKESPLSDSLRQAVNQFFSDYTKDQKKD